MAEAISVGNRHSAPEKDVSVSPTNLDNAYNCRMSARAQHKSPLKQSNVQLGGISSVKREHTLYRGCRYPEKWMLSLAAYLTSRRNPDLVVNCRVHCHLQP